MPAGRAAIIHYDHRMPCRSLIVCCALLAAGPAAAVEWLTVTGDKSDPQVDTTQLDVSTYKRRSPGATMLRFRVNLAQPRKMGGNEVYQSYISNIVVDCGSASIFHENQLRYRDPLWEGPSTAETFVQPKPMAFGGLSNGPRDKILKMVCQPRAGH